MVNDLLSKLEKKKTEKAFIKSRIKEKKEKSIELDKKLISAIKAREIIQIVAKATQENLKFHISTLVSTALSIFEDNIEFVVKIVTRRNKTECDLFFKEGEFEYSPMHSSGGGVKDITSFALRLALWSLNKTAPIFILDEPFKNLSENYQDKATEMVKMLSDKLGVQIIMASHEKEAIASADKVFKVTKTDRSVVKEISHGNN